MSEEAGQVIEEERDPQEEAIRLAGARADPPVPRPGAQAGAAREVEEFDDDLRRLVERMSSS